MFIKKEIVLKTNKSDRNYLSITEMKLEEYNKYLEENGEISLEISFYKTKEDKKLNKKVDTYTIKIKSLKKMGVRSYNKRDSKKHTYRVKYSGEKVKEKKSINEKLTDFLIKYTNPYIPKFGSFGFLDKSTRGDIKDNISVKISKKISNIF